MTCMEKINKQLETQMEGLVLRVKVAEEERKKAIEDMGTDRRKREEVEKDLKRRNEQIKTIKTTTRAGTYEPDF